MKLLVKYAGRRKRMILEAKPESLIREIKKQIQVEFKLAIIPFRLYAIICNGFKILLTESFPLSFFNFSTGDMIEVDTYGYLTLNSRNKCRNSTYLNTLNLTMNYPISDNIILDEIIEYCKQGNEFEFVLIAIHVK